MGNPKPKVPTLPPIPGTTNGSTPVASPANSGAWTGITPGGQTVAGGAGGIGPMSLDQFQQMSVSPYLNYSADSLSPHNAPAIWGLDVTGPDDIFVSSYSHNTPVPSKLRYNRLLGNLADKLGVIPKKGQSTQEAVIDKLGQMYHIPDKVLDSKDGLHQLAGAMGVNIFSPHGKPNEQQVLYGIADKLGVANPAGIQPGTGYKTISRAQVAQQLAGMKGPEIQTLKAALFAGGFYDAKDMTSPTLEKEIDGSKLDPYTMKAFGNMLNQAAEQYKQGHHVTWTDYLYQQAGSNTPGFQDGMTIQQLLADPKLSGNSSKTQPGTSMPLATGDQLLSSLQNAFEQNLGRMPTASELNQFVGQFNQMNEAKATSGASQNANGAPSFDYETGLTLAPGVPRVASAAEIFAKSDQPAYIQHQFANAGGQLLDIIKGAGLGENPNQVQVG